MSKAGRPPKIAQAQRGELVAIVEANPTATFQEIRQELARRTGG